MCNSTTCTVLYPLPRFPAIPSSSCPRPSVQGVWKAAARKQTQGVSKLDLEVPAGWVRPILPGTHTPTWVRWSRSSIVMRGATERAGRALRTAVRACGRCVDRHTRPGTATTISAPTIRTRPQSLAPSIRFRRLEKVSSKAVKEHPARTGGEGRGKELTLTLTLTLERAWHSPSPAVLVACGLLNANVALCCIHIAHHYGCYPVGGPALSTRRRWSTNSLGRLGLATL
jgi:hypothetical protein